MTLLSVALFVGVVVARLLGPDGYPLDGPLGARGWLWLAANIEAVLASVQEEDVPADVPVLADLEPPPEPWEEEMLF